MFDKSLLLQHIQNQDINEQSSSKPMTDREYYDAAMKQDALKAEKKKIRSKMEMDSLKKTVRSDSYRNASQSERQNMIDKSYQLRSVGDNPNINMSDAEFSVAQDVRRENISRDMDAKLAAMTPEQRQASYDKRSAARYERGRKAAQGGPITSMGDVRAMKDYFASNRKDYKNIAAPVMKQAKQAIKVMSNLDPKVNNTPTKIATSVFKSRGIDTKNPDLVKFERERRQVLAGQTRVGLDNLLRKRMGMNKAGFGSASRAASSGRF